MMTTWILLFWSPLVLFQIPRRSMDQRFNDVSTLGSRYPNCSDTETPSSDSLSEQILSELVWILRPHPCLDTKAPQYLYFDSSHPNSDTMNRTLPQPLVIHHSNKFTNFIWTSLDTETSTPGSDTEAPQYLNFLNSYINSYTETPIHVQIPRSCFEILVMTTFNNYNVDEGQGGY
jgi:hypothetical protein